ncbi:MAG: carboxylesterase family protein [Clostridia bacterium]|nr:carboxylesterase family protein [Clostridia bacterium]
MNYLVTTPCGTVQGTAGRVPGTAAYKGIRYATAGRWEYPRQMTRWDGVYDATAYGSCCYQLRAFFPEEELAKKVFYYNEFRKGASYTYSEDCLFLNIWTPDTAKAGDRLPVLVYIHGGSFTGGCGHEKHFDGPVWPTRGVIAVTLNYRLGPLGFLCLPELREEAGCTGNYGLYDQLTALQWLRDNIAAFGGDPGNVTIMGQSAGAMSVQQHALSPLSDGLFHRAVMSSGGGVHKMLSAPQPEKHFDFWHAVMERAGCADLAQFRALPADALFSVWRKAKGEIKGGGMATSPVLDGRLVVGTGSELTAAGKQKKIPYLIGSTSEDMMPPILYKMGKDWCAAQQSPSYLWFFDRQLPGDENGAWHSSDLWYWFGTLENSWRPMTDKDRALSAQMVDYLCSFAKTGDPNGAGRPRWEACGKGQPHALRLGEDEARMGSPGTMKLLYTMLTNKSVGE